MIDFHIHTKMSDGQYFPSEIVKKVKNSGISVFAITDHDTISGLEEGRKAVEELSDDDGSLTMLNGVELNINWRTGGEFHLLGLGFKNVSPRFADVLSSLQKNRDARNEIVVSKMNEAGIDVTFAEIQNMFAGQTIGRPHFAKFLVEKGIVKNLQTAFKKYLAKGMPFYVRREGANLDEAVTAIVESGGVPVIAHPLSLYESWSRMEKTLQNIFERGVAGLEAYHSGSTWHEAKRLEELARKFGFFVTGGSDFHGEALRADRKLGHGAGGRPIEDRFWTEELLPYLQNEN